MIETYKNVRVQYENDTSDYNRSILAENNCIFAQVQNQDFLVLKVHHEIGHGSSFSLFFTVKCVNL
jgi:hypothetical protein